ncbi:hypothetical protein LUZ60_010310 [Juncus effusus]|nr:hypothetical protein LUZ60_010310 [Juncus effusus]
MEVEDEASSSASRLADVADHSSSPIRSSAVYKFKQQNLPGWKPALTPSCVITIFLLLGVVFIPIGLICLRASQNIVEIRYRYDSDCIPEPYKVDKIGYIKDSSISKKCIRKIKVHGNMKAPIFIYYELDNYYQNHRRYVKSRNDKQLLHGLNQTNTHSCSPLQSSNGIPIVPCGLIAWSLFNDTFDFKKGHKEEHLRINRRNISWRSDRERKFGKDVYPFNFQNGSLIGGASLDPNLPLSEQEDLIVWMRTSALPKFRKLYGVITEDLGANTIISIQISNNYNTYSFGGTKSIILTTPSWLGRSKNNFLGFAYLLTGFSSVLLAIFFALIHVKNPRPHGDPTYQALNRKSSSS